MKKVVFELGGKGPALIFNDANLEEAAQGTEFSINFNSGQTCMANSRIYIQEGVVEKFLKIFKKLASSRIMGDPTKLEVNHGPQADKVQYKAVLKYIGLGKETGKIAIGEEQVLRDSSLTVNPVIFLE